MSSSKGSTTSSSFKPPAEFMEAYEKSLNMAKQAVNTPYQQYTGDLVAGLSPSQLQGLANINAAQGIALPGIQKGMEYSQEAAQGITPELYQQFYSPYVRDVADTTFANLMESQAQQQSNLKSGAIQSGAFGGDRGGVAQAELARQQQLGNAQGMANIYNQGYGQAMGLAGQQVANLGSMGNQIANLAMLGQGSILQGAQAQMAAGAQQQATEQARLQAAYDQWMQFMAQPYQNAQFYANIAQGLGAGAGGTSSTTAPAPNLMSQIFGGIGAIGSIYSSDERLKENIEPIGALNDGQTIYRFNYKGDPKLQIGLIAQEVEKKHPNAVMRDRSGMRMVDYDEATEDAAQMSSMGGVVGPDGGRQFLAEGGLAFYPYGYAQGYIPEGKIGSRGSTIPDAPKPFDDQGLAQDWANIMPITKEQASGIRKLGEDVGILDVKPSPPPKSKKSEEDDDSTFDFVKYPISVSSSMLEGAASGGVVGRGGYADGGDAEYPELIQSESGGDFGAQNEQGYVGRAQFGPARLIDLKRAGVIPPDMTPEQFRNNKDAQIAAEKWHFGDINNFIDQSGLGRLEGKTIKGVPITREGLVNVAHLGGKTGLKRFVTSGGRDDFADDNGTRLSDYLAMAADKSGVASSDVVPAAETRSGVAAAEEAPRSRFNMGKLFASEDNPSIIERIMGKRLSPEARSAIMNASFALMAGRSPFFFTNVGEAGKVGTQTYYNALGQQSDIARKNYEAQTGRQQVEVSERNAQRQQAALVLPLIRTLMAMGQPVPDVYMRMLEDAFPSGSPERESVDESLKKAATSPGAAAQTPAIPAVESAPSASAATPATPAPAPATPAPSATPSPEVSSDDIALQDIYKQLPQESSPYYWEERAKIAEKAGDADLAQQYRDKASDIRTKDFDRGYFAIPGKGRIPYPYKLEQKRDEKVTEAQADVDVKATDEAMQRAQTNVQTYQTSLNALEQAAASLAKTDTGQLEDTKAYLVSVLRSLGVPQDADRIEQATGVEELRKAFSFILFNGGLKDKIGSQIAASELEMFSRGFPDVKLLPGTNRYVVGTMRGLLDMERQRAKDFIDFAKEKNGPLSRRDLIEWELDWNNNNSVTEFVKAAIANTPVKGEVDWKRWASDPEYQKKSKFIVGYKYVMPDGKIKVYTGNPEDKYFVSEESGG